MQEITTSRLADKASRGADNWIRCNGCGHKLFKLLNVPTGRKGTADIEIKCHSCKKICVFEL